MNTTTRNLCLTVIGMVALLALILVAQADASATGASNVAGVEAAARLERFVLLHRGW